MEVGALQVRVSCLCLCMSSLRQARERRCVVSLSCGCAVYGGERRGAGGKACGPSCVRRRALATLPASPQLRGEQEGRGWVAVRWWQERGAAGGEGACQRWRAQRWRAQRRRALLGRFLSPRPLLSPLAPSTLVRSCSRSHLLLLLSLLLSPVSLALGCSCCSSSRLLLLLSLSFACSSCSCSRLLSLSLALHTPTE